MLSLMSTMSHAQLSGIKTDKTAPYNDIEYLIKDVLSDGSANISNVTYTYGDPSQIGFFYDTTATNILGFEDGVFMSTLGSVPIETPSTQPWPYPNWGPPTIQDPSLIASLQLLFGANYSAAQHDQNNLIIIEFDIEAGLDYFEFWYSFASREYEDYTCSGSYNDVFGFYVSGPNPNNPNAPYVNQNIALIPNNPQQTTFSTNPVSINSVNSGAASGSWDPNNCANANQNWTNDAIFFNNNYGSNPVNFHYTGFTDPLKAYVQAECGETYHMKLAICDVSDGGLPSAVFLEKGSLRSPVDVTVEPAPNVYPDTNGWFYEGCGTASIKFKRPTAADFAPGTGDLVVNFTLLGDAIYDVDYDFLNNPWSDHVVIPNWDTEFELHISPFADGINENVESLTIQIPHLAGQSCNSDYVEVELFIADYPEIEINLVDEIDTHCPGDEVTFEVSVSGGLPINSVEPYNIHWSQIGYAHEQTVSPEETTTYYVEIEDLCPEYEHLDSVVVNVSVWPELIIDDLEDQYICTDIADQYDFLNNKVHGGDGLFTYSWVDINTGYEVSTEENPLLFSGEYEITIRDGCENQATNSVTIFHFELPDAEILAEEQGVERTMQLSINEFPVNSNFAFMIVDYAWDLGDGSPIITNKGPIIHQYPEFGFYTITLTSTNDQGCQKVFTRDIEVSPFMNIPTIFTPNGDGSNEGFSPVSSRQYTSFEMQIFDRWGKEIFESDDISKKWYGKTKDGLVCGEGIYVYKIKVKYPNYPDVIEHDGVLHLTR